MSLFDRLRRKPPEPPDRPAIALQAVLAALNEHLASLEKKAIEPALVRARLADWLRDAGLEPPAPAQVDAWASSGFGRETWRRLALLVDALGAGAVSGPVAKVAAQGGAAPFVQNGMLGAATKTPLLTLSLLRESEVRLEELARSWLAALGLGIEGETAAQSAEKLVQLDYVRLLQKADRAKQDAEARMAALREKQEQAEKARAGRSKW
jgi:hypothetical protein